MRSHFPNIKLYKTTYLEEVADQHPEPCLWVLDSVQLGIFVQHALEDLQEEFQRELVQEVHLAGNAECQNTTKPHLQEPRI